MHVVLRKSNVFTVYPTQVQASKSIPDMLEKSDNKNKDLGIPLSTFVHMCSVRHEFMHHD